MNRKERKERRNRIQLGEKAAKKMAEVKINEQKNEIIKQQQDSKNSFKDRIKFEKPELEIKNADPEFIKVVEDITNGYTRNLYDLAVMRSMYSSKKTKSKFSSIEHFQIYQKLVEKVNKNIDPETGDYLEAYRKTQKECETPEEVYILNKIIEAAEKKINDKAKAQKEANEELSER